MIWGCMSWDGVGYAAKIDGRMVSPLVGNTSLVAILGHDNICMVPCYVLLKVIRIGSSGTFWVLGSLATQILLWSH